ncbi:MAG: hypothetical protein FWF31_11510, partial [Desulfobulbus sp.]|nr:hypothetical protein [Desulfobulbus sp.]
MNQLAWLEQQIAQTERLLASHRAWHDQYPDSFSDNLVFRGKKSAFRSCSEAIARHGLKNGT